MLRFRWLTRPGRPERPGRERWPGRARHPQRRGRRMAAPGRSWAVAGAAGRRPDERLAGARRDGGDGGLALPVAEALPRTGQRAGLLTVWLELGQHGPGARRSPRRVRRESGTCGPGVTMPPGLEPQGP